MKPASPHLQCPSCGSTELRCRPPAETPRLLLAPAWLLSKGMVWGVSASVVAAVFVNLFFLDADIISPAMFWTQVGIGAGLILLACVGAWYGGRRRRQGLLCRCLLCGQQWQDNA